VRATHAVSRGTWYWEATVEELPDGAATRIGWAQEYANLQAPCGYDKFAYAWRSRKGTAFSESRGRHYAEAYTEGDVLGFLIVLPESPAMNYIPPTYKDRPLVKFKSHLYYEEKDKVQESLKNLKTLSGSKILCFKNGICMGEGFTDINNGAYYPAISIHKSATVSVNFGPGFKHEPPQEYNARGMYEKAEEAIIEQTTADLLFLTENDGKLRLDLW
jgi:Set1/Ash2 histone methyltransferase complex subunit ASH2